MTLMHPEASRTTGVRLRERPLGCGTRSGGVPR
jgi:hypothetical protein